MSVHPLFDVIDIHAPTSPVEALTLGLCLAVGAWAGKRLGGMALALLLVSGQLVGFLLVGHVAIAFAGAAAALAATRTVRPGSVSSRGFALQGLVLGTGMLAYQAGRIVARSDAGPATEHGRAIIDFERRLGLYVEPDVQGGLMSVGHLTDAINDFYSFGFMAVVAGALVYLFCCDRQNYVLLRNGLGISAALAVAAIALYPTAPPRLLAESGLTDSVVAAGRSHNFTNEFAAVPSLHVGWMALTGWVLGRHAGGRWRWPLAVIPGTTMAVVVMATGNHFWIDAAVGTMIAVIPAVILVNVNVAADWAMRARTAAFRARAARALSTTKTRASMLAMLGLLTYLVVGEMAAPGFTAFWGYLVFQMAATLLLLLAFEIVLVDQGGISWTTHVVAISCGYLDVFGTSGDLYAQIDEYDKITHFMGVAAITSGAYELLRALNQRGMGPRAAHDRLMAAIVLGTAVGVGWEVYEFLGDRVFNSARVQGRWDTANDLVSDFLGAAVVVAILAWIDRIPASEAEAGPATAGDGSA